MKLCKKLKLEIRSKQWTFFLYDTDTYHKLVGADSRALTEVEKHEVYFSPEYLTLPVIRHELIHVFIESYSHYNVEFTNDQLEEVFCSIIEYYYESIDEIANKISNHFKKFIKKRKP